MIISAPLRFSRINGFYRKSFLEQLRNVIEETTEAEVHKLWMLPIKSWIETITLERKI